MTIPKRNKRRPSNREQIQKLRAEAHSLYPGAILRSAARYDSTVRI